MLEHLAEKAAAKAAKDGITAFAEFLGVSSVAGIPAALVAGLAAEAIVEIVKRVLSEKETQSDEKSNA